MKAAAKRSRPHGRLSDLVHSIHHNADRLAALAARDKQLDAQVVDLAVLSRLLFHLRDLASDPRPHVYAEPVLLPSPHVGGSMMQPFLRCCLHVGRSGSQPLHQHPSLGESSCIPLAGMEVERHRLAVSVQMEPHFAQSTGVEAEASNPRSWRISHTVPFSFAQDLGDDTWSCDIPLDLQTTRLPLRTSVSLVFLLPSDGTLVALPIPVADAVIDLLHFASITPLRILLPFQGIGLPTDVVERHIVESFADHSPPPALEPPPPIPFRGTLRLRMSRATRSSFFSLLFTDSAQGSSLITSAVKLACHVPNPTGPDREPVHVSMYLSPILAAEPADAPVPDAMDMSSHAYPELHDVTLTVTAPVLAAVLAVKRAVVSRVAEWMGCDGDHQEQQTKWKVPRLEALAVEMELDRLARDGRDTTDQRAQEQVVALANVVEGWVGPIVVRGPDDG